MLSTTMFSVILLSAIILNVMAPVIFAGTFAKSTQNWPNLNLMEQSIFIIFAGKLTYP